MKNIFNRVGGGADYAVGLSTTILLLTIVSSRGAQGSFGILTVLRTTDGQGLVTSSVALTGDPSLTPVLEKQNAWRVSAPIPGLLTGRPVLVHFDLFHNQNGIESIGFFGGLAAVLEPRTAMLAMLGLSLILAVCKTELMTKWKK